MCKMREGTRFLRLFIALMVRRVSPYKLNMALVNLLSICYYIGITAEFHDAIVVPPTSPYSLLETPIEASVKANLSK